VSLVFVMLHCFLTHLLTCVILSWATTRLILIN
jgi:hypothetical protein